jgi:plasmid replication initiation protein
MSRHPHSLPLFRKREVVKHSASISIPMVFSLSERQIWNVLLANAFDDLLDESIHYINKSDLLSALEKETRNTEWLKEKLRHLQSYKVEFNLLEKDRVVWGSHVLLASVEIEDGVIAYSYGGLLAERLHDPDIYSRIHLAIQNKLSSKHSQALYELLLDYRGAGAAFNKGEGTTGKIPLDTLKLLLGAFEQEEEDGEITYSLKYDEYYDFRRYVLDPAVEEVNKETNLEARYETFRDGRSIAGATFYVRDESTNRLPRKAQVSPQDYLSEQSSQEQRWVRLKSLRLLHARLKQEGEAYRARMLREKGPNRPALQDDYAEALKDAIRMYQHMSEEERSRTLQKMEEAKKEQASLDL